MPAESVPKGQPGGRGARKTEAVKGVEKKWWGGHRPHRLSEGLCVLFCVKQEAIGRFWVDKSCDSSSTENRRRGPWGEQEKPFRAHYINSDKNITVAWTRVRVAEMARNCWGFFFFFFNIFGGHPTEQGWDFYSGTFFLHTPAVPSEDEPMSLLSNVSPVSSCIQTTGDMFSSRN